jgi:3-hydroxyacyl-CoA dehydrogenase
MTAEPAITPVNAGASTPERAEAKTLIRKAGVLGAGTMGSRIAAHLANAGLEVVLLDIPADGPARSGIAGKALDALQKARPAAFYDASFAGRIKTGNFEDDLSQLADCDWVIEAVTPSRKKTIDP